MGLNRTLTAIRRAVRENIDNARDLFDVILDVLSVKVLKPYFGVETRRYLEFHDARAKRIQMKLDWEHNTTIASLYWQPDYE